MFGVEISRGQLKKGRGVEGKDKRGSPPLCIRLAGALLITSLIRLAPVSSD